MTLKDNGISGLRLLDVARLHGKQLPGCSQNKSGYQRLTEPPDPHNDPQGRGDGRFDAMIELSCLDKYGRTQPPLTLLQEKSWEGFPVAKHPR